MKIEDYDSMRDVKNPVDIESALSKRYNNGANAFWLSHGCEEFPKIGILVKGDLANVHYFPEEGSAGFVSAADALGSGSGETITFFVRPTEKIWIRDNAVIPFRDALKVAREFAISKSIPRCIQWSEL